MRPGALTEKGLGQLEDSSCLIPTCITEERTARTQRPLGIIRQGQHNLSQRHRQDRKPEVGRAPGRQGRTEAQTERRGAEHMEPERERRRGRERVGAGWLCASCTPWAPLTWAPLTCVPNTRLSRWPCQSCFWLSRTLFVPPSAFPWAGGAPCRPQRVAQQNALNLPWKPRPTHRDRRPVQRRGQVGASGRVRCADAVWSPRSQSEAGGASVGPTREDSHPSPSPRHPASSQHSHHQLHPRQERLPRSEQEDSPVAPLLPARSASQRSRRPALPSFQILLKKPENPDFMGTPHNSVAFENSDKKMVLAHPPPLALSQLGASSGFSHRPTSASCGCFLKISLHLKTRIEEGNSISLLLETWCSAR